MVSEFSPEYFADLSLAWCGGDDDGVVVGHEPPEDGTDASPDPENQPEIPHQHQPHTNPTKLSASRCTTSGNSLQNSIYQTSRSNLSSRNPAITAIPINHPTSTHDSGHGTFGSVPAAITRVRSF